MKPLRKLGRGIAALRGDDRGRYYLADRAARALHPDAILSEQSRVWLADKAFREEYDRLDPLNKRRMDRAWNLAQWTRRTRDVEGDTAECGVFEGLTSYFICRENEGTGKVHHMFDSFEGVSEPGDSDGSYWHAGDLSADESVARRNLARFEGVRFYPGWIPDRFPEVADRTFSLVHIDVDLYQPTRDLLDFFLPRMAPGGVVVLDDYGFTTCPGARRAVDESCAAMGLRVFECASAQGVVILP